MADESIGVLELTLGVANGEFISKLLETDEDRSIVTAIIQVAHAYNLKTTAEGIEHHAAIAPLLSIGCDLGQGFHFAKPLESGEIDLILLGEPVSSAL